METRSSTGKSIRVDYKQLINRSVKLPRARKQPSAKTDLFPVEIVSEDSQSGRVKVHYIGYGVEFDEWKNLSEVETTINSDGEVRGEEIPPSNEDSVTATSVASVYEPLYEPYSPYKDLRIRIKRGLSCSRTGSPTVKISMPFDMLLFNGGLKCVGIPSEERHGVQHYKIKNYEDLNELLGRDWHFRGININGDYGYAVLKTVDFYLLKSRKFVEYVPSKHHNVFDCIKTDTGHSLVFSLVCDYGTSETFGTDETIFSLS